MTNDSTAFYPIAADRIGPSFEHFGGYLSCRSPADCGHKLEGTNLPFCIPFRESDAFPEVPAGFYCTCSLLRPTVGIGCSTPHPVSLAVGYLQIPHALLALAGFVLAISLFFHAQYSPKTVSRSDRIRMTLICLSIAVAMACQMVLSLTEGYIRVGLPLSEGFMSYIGGVNFPLTLAMSIIAPMVLLLTWTETMRHITLSRFRSWSVVWVFLMLFCTAYLVILVYILVELGSLVYVFVMTAVGIFLTALFYHFLSFMLKRHIRGIDESMVAPLQKFRSALSTLGWRFFFLGISFIVAIVVMMAMYLTPLYSTDVPLWLRVVTALSSLTYTYSLLFLVWSVLLFVISTNSASDWNWRQCACCSGEQLDDETAKSSERKREEVPKGCCHTFCIKPWELLFYPLSSVMDSSKASRDTNSRSPEEVPEANIETNTNFFASNTSTVKLGSNQVVNSNNQVNRV